jgi:hypothetical protein
MTLAVDFDGTLSFGKWPGVGPANTKLINFLLHRKSKGDKLILWTCRANKELEDAVIWCQEQGLVFDSVNDNLPEVVAYYGVTSRKISCDYYIDDKAITSNIIDLLEVRGYEKDE